MTTVVRHKAYGEEGYVYVVDWEQKKVLHRLQLPPPQVRHDRTLGPRGITFLNGLCYVANADTLFGYSADWELKHTISHPWFAHIHEIAATDETIWVTSTGCDAVLEVDEQSRVVSEYFLGEQPDEVRNAVGISPRRIDRRRDYRRDLWQKEVDVAHPNAVSIHSGRPYVTLWKQGAVIALNPVELIWKGSDLSGCHSGRPIDNGKTLLIAGSYQRALIVIDVPSGRIVNEIELCPEDGYALASPSPLQKLQQALRHWGPGASWVRSHVLSRFPYAWRPRPAPPFPGFTRGIAVWGPDRAIVGTTPAGLTVVNLVTGVPEDRMRLDDRVAYSVFSISIDPRTSAR